MKTAGTMVLVVIFFVVALITMIAAAVLYPIIKLIQWLSSRRN